MLIPYRDPRFGRSPLSPRRSTASHQLVATGTLPFIRPCCSQRQPAVTFLKWTGFSAMWGTVDTCKYQSLRTPAIDWADTRVLVSIMNATQDMCWVTTGGSVEDTQVGSHCKALWYSALIVRLWCRSRLTALSPLPRLHPTTRSLSLGHPPSSSGVQSLKQPFWTVNLVIWLITIALCLRLGCTICDMITKTLLVMMYLDVLAHIEKPKYRIVLGMLQTFVSCASDTLVIYTIALAFSVTVFKSKVGLNLG